MKNTGFPSQKKDKKLNDLLLYKDLKSVSLKQILQTTNNLDSILSDRRFDEIFDAITRLHIQYARGDHKENYIISATSKYFFTLIDFLSEKEGIELKNPNSTQKPILKTNILPSKDEQSLKRKIFFFLRFLYRSRGNTFNFKASFKQSLFCMEFPLLSFAKDFAAYKGANIIYLEKGLIRQSKDTIPQHAHDFFNIIKDRIEKLNILLTQEEEEKLYSLWLEFYQYCHSYFNASLKHVRRYNISNFIAQSIGNIEVRTYALAVRFNGGTVYGFGHAHDVGLFPVELKHVISQILSPLSEFITRSTLIKTLVSNLINTVHDHNYNDIKVNVIPPNKQYPQRNLVKPIETVKKVFIYETGIIEQRYNSEKGLLYWPYQINLFRRIGKLFHNNRESRSYSVYLKGRPSRFYLTKKIYSGFYDGLIETRFEDVVDQADLIIFHQIATTSFVPALSSQAYIIIFKEVLNHCWKEIIPLFESRCMVLNSWKESDGSVGFDQDQLLDFIENPRPFKPWVTP